MDNSFLQQAIEMAVENVRRGGGPFGALIVKAGVVIATGTNQVTRTNDPTAHAEIVAIREACRVLGDFQLDGCDVYSSCEPCPMCLGALYWARPARIFFAASHAEAAAAAVGARKRIDLDQLRLGDLCDHGTVRARLHAPVRQILAVAVSDRPSTSKLPLGLSEPEFSRIDQEDLSETQTCFPKNFPVSPPVQTVAMHRTLPSAPRRRKEGVDLHRPRKISLHGNISGEVDEYTAILGFCDRRPASQFVHHDSRKETILAAQKLQLCPPAYRL